MLKNLILWLFIGIILVSLFSNFQPRDVGQERLSYSDFLNKVDAGNISTAVIDDHMIHGKLSDDKTYSTYMPMDDQYLLGELMKKNVEVTGQEPEQEGLLTHILISWFPTLLLIG